jgi:bifunctional oligoribonuclease and PAP phosphatase NrnA
VTQQMMQEVGASPEHTDNFTDYIRAIEGVEVGVYYTELSPGHFKISLRSKGIVNVEKIAGIFGGGGHERAAACRLEGTYEALQEKINRAIMASDL